MNNLTSLPTKKPSGQAVSSASLPTTAERRAPAGPRALRWFDWEARPELTEMAAGIDLKGCEGGAQRLANKTAVMGGLGAVGGETFSLLSKFGVGSLIGVDLDRYEPESWMTQPASPFDAGRLKARIQGERAHVANPGSQILTAAGFAQDLPLWKIRQADVLLVAGDNLEILVWAGNMACAFGIPLYQGAVHGETWTAFVRAYDFSNSNSPCPACAFSEADWSRLTSRRGCDPGTMRVQGVESTRTLPNVCRTAADLLATEALKVLLNADGQMVNEELAFCLLSYKSMRTSFEKNPAGCRCPHSRWNVIDFHRDLRETTLAMLAIEASKLTTCQPDKNRPLGGLPLSGEQSWISFTFCTNCNRQIPIRQFGFAGMDLDACECGQPLRATPVGVRSTIPTDDLREIADVSLADLRLPQGAAVGFSADEDQFWFFVGEPPQLKAERCTSLTKTPPVVGLERK